MISHSTLNILLTIKKIIKMFINIINFYINHLTLTFNNYNYFNGFNYLKNSMYLKFYTSTDFTVVNYPENKNEFELIYLLLSYNLNYKIWCKIDKYKEDLIFSLCSNYININWLEREIWDFFGSKFIYHSDLRRISTDYGFSGHPLLKNFPLTGFVELRYDDITNKIVVEGIELMQAYRLFHSFNPWNFWQI